MSSPLLIVLLCVLSSSYGLPLLEQTVFTEFMKTANLNGNSPKKEGELVKRNAFELNSDAELKRISLQALIGNLETSLYKSALSVSNVPHDARSIIEEVKPAATERGITKRNTEVADEHTAHNAEAVVGIKPESTTESLSNMRKVLLQTTEKVPEQAGVPAHIIIDRISIQPHNGGLPLIPAFQVHYSKITSGVANLRKDIEDKSKKSSIETNISTNTHAAGVPPNTDHTTAVGSTTESSSIAAHHESSSAKVTHHEGSTTSAAHHEGSTTTAAPHESSSATIQHHTSSTAAINAPSSTTVVHPEDVSTTASTTAGSSTEHSSTSSTTTPTSTATTTTKAPIVELKEAEEELREKVAEIEAEPIIFSSRI